MSPLEDIIRETKIKIKKSKVTIKKKIKLSNKIKKKEKKQMMTPKEPQKIEATSQRAFKPLKIGELRTKLEREIEQKKAKIKKPSAGQIISLHSPAAVEFPEIIVPAKEKENPLQPHLRRIKKLNHKIFVAHKKSEELLLRLRKKQRKDEKKHLKKIKPEFFRNEIQFMEPTMESEVKQTPIKQISKSASSFQKDKSESEIQKIKERLTRLEL